MKLEEKKRAPTYVDREGTNRPAAYARWGENKTRKKSEQIKEWNPVRIKKIVGEIAQGCRAARGEKKR
jgi:hypothetical protein